MEDFARYIGEATSLPGSAVLMANLFGDGDPAWIGRTSDFPPLYGRFLAALGALWQGKEVDRREVLSLERDLAAHPEPWAGEARIELSALAGCRDHSALAAAGRARLDSLIAAGPSESDWSAYRPLLVARCREWQGDLPAARRALRWRPNEAWSGLPYLAMYLKEEGRLALAVGDSASAIRAWDHYLMLRASPDPGLVPGRDEIRAQRDALLHRGIVGRGDRRNHNPG
jgi:hypothetical protein